MVLVPLSAATRDPGSFDDPTVHADQDWTVSYEGVLPNTSGLVADMASTDPTGSYNSLTLTAKGGSFCERGIEDWSIGQMRANSMINALPGSWGRPPSPLRRFPSISRQASKSFARPRVANSSPCWCRSRRTWN